MHPEAKRFTLLVKSLFPQYFQGNLKVLDIGSGDINGNNRELFTDECKYVGIDVANGKNVDVISTAGNFNMKLFSTIHSGCEESKLDVIVSTECFEHDIDFVNSLRNATKLLKEGGLFFFTCASTLRPEHGTVRTSANDSFSTQLGSESAFWYPNYYRNLTSEDVQKALPINLYYNKFYFEYETSTKDLYFWGIRNGNVLDENNLTEENRNLAKIQNIYNSFNTDKNSSYHNYTKYYHNYLEEYSFKSLVKVLEIGVFQGNSLRAIREYLKNAIEIVGIDIAPQCKNIESPVDHIRIEIGSQDDVEFLKNVSNKRGSFDIIIDDGSHKVNHVITSFETLFPLLNDGGIYIIEDTVCFRDKQFIEEGMEHLQYFSNYLHFLNQWNMQNVGYSGKYPNCVDPEKIDRKTDNPFEYGIDSIHFGVSHIVIKKKLRKNWIL